MMIIATDVQEATKLLPLQWPTLLLPFAVTPSPAVQVNLSSIDWTLLIETAQQQQVAPLLYWRLNTWPVDKQPPKPIMERLRSIYLAATVAAMMQGHELQTVLSALTAVNLHPTLYKGAALAHTLYPTPACRPMGDLDLWLSREDMPAAQAALETLGYQQRMNGTRPIALHQQYDGEVQLVSQQDNRGLVELHWGVFAGEWLKHAATINRTDVYQRRVQAEIVGYPVYLLANEDAVIQLAVHLGINHQLSLHPLRSLIDILLLDQQGVDWLSVVERVRAWRLTTVVGAVLKLAIMVFGTAAVSPAFCEAAATLAYSPLRQTLTKRWVCADTVLNQTQIRAHRSRFFYLLSMVDRPLDAYRLLHHTLWPAFDWLALRYGQSNLRTRLQHLVSSLRGDI